MNRTRIALALEYPLLQQGGTEVLVRELLRGLSPHFDIVLVSGDKELSDIPREFSSLVCAHFSWQKSPATADRARALAEGLFRQRIDLAHFHFGGTYEWQTQRFWRSPVYHLAKGGVPCLSTNHLAVEWLNCCSPPDWPVWRKFIRQIAGLASRSMVYRKLAFEVCVSKHDRSRVIRMFPLFRRKILQIYHSLLQAETEPAQLQGRAPVVLCVGTIGGRKAQPILAEAFARIAATHPAWHLDLIGRVGDPAAVAHIEEITATCGLAGRINLLGRLSDEETLGRMKNAALIAMPSLQEGLGLSLQEALFHGCVAVGTTAGGIPELIDDEQNGLLVEPGNIQALSAALDRLMSNPALLEGFRAQTRSSILRKGMTSTAMVQNYLNLYEKLYHPKSLLEGERGFTYA